MFLYTEFGLKIPSGHAFSELGFIGTPLTTNRSAQYLDHLSVKYIQIDTASEYKQYYFNYPTFVSFFDTLQIPNP